MEIVASCPAVVCVTSPSPLGRASLTCSFQAETTLSPKLVLLITHISLDKLCANKAALERS